MSAFERISIVENMKELAMLVDDLRWLQRAKDFIKALEQMIYSLSDKDFFAYLKRWQKEYLREVQDQIFSKIALQSS